METWTEVYARCMDGEYFRGRYRDGHSNDTSMWVSETVERLRAEGMTPSLDELLRQGFDGDPSDIIVVAFARQEDAPDWLRPDG